MGDRHKAGLSTAPKSSEKTILIKFNKETSGDVNVRSIKGEYE
jgi:hypothetical protein